MIFNFTTNPDEILLYPMSPILVIFEVLYKPLKKIFIKNY